MRRRMTGRRPDNVGTNFLRLWSLMEFLAKIGRKEVSLYTNELSESLLYTEYG